MRSAAGTLAQLRACRAPALGGLDGIQAGSAPAGFFLAAGPVFLRATGAILGPKAVLPLPEAPPGCSDQSQRTGQAVGAGGGR